MANPADGTPIGFPELDGTLFIDRAKGSYSLVKAMVGSAAGRWSRNESALCTKSRWMGVESAAGLESGSKGDGMRAMHGCRSMAMVLAFGTVLGMASWAPPAAAADGGRGMHWQFSLPITFTSGASYSSDGGSSVKIDDDLGWGIGFGYNFNENFMVGADFTWLSANYDAKIATDTDGDQVADTIVDVGGTLDAANVQFVGQYNILKGRVTPFLRANLGWTWIDSNIPSGPVQGVCWWDPWYGYICNTWQPTFQESSFAYGAAAGVRGELTEKFFIEGSYNVLWVDFDRAGTQSFDGIRMNLGWTF